MIPYDDLVAALQSWRARQGLPVSTIGQGGSAPTATPAHAATPGSGPRTAPPPAPPKGGRTLLHHAPASADVEDAEMLEEQPYESTTGESVSHTDQTAPRDREEW
jgi:hypothetical protein